MSLPVSQMEGRVHALFSDIDGTLTTNGRIEAATFVALERLAHAGVNVVLVTGRPAGWAQALLCLTHVTAVVSENGGVTFAERAGRVHKIYGIPESELAGWRTRMHAAVASIARELPQVGLSSDSAYREVDLAIDWNEEASLPVDRAEQVVERLREAGLTAVRSSVHVNFGPPGFDKASACKRVVSDVLGGDPGDLAPYVYVGDALNDSPAFGAFPRSVGVANVRAWWDRLEHQPRYVCDANEGAGLREVIAHILHLQA